MTARKKLIILISILSVVLVMAITATVIVLVASSQQAKSNVAVKYTATGVVGELSASYHLNEANKVAMKNTSGESVVSLDAEKTSGVLSPDKNLILDKNATRVIFEYKFNNTSSATPMNVRLSHLPSSAVEGEVFENVKVQYLLSSEEINLEYYDQVEFVETELLGISFIVPTNTYRYVYLKVGYLNISKDADFLGSISWTLEKATTNNDYAITIKDTNNANMTNISSTMVLGDQTKTINVFMREGMSAEYITATAVSENGETLVFTKGEFTETEDGFGYVPLIVSRPFINKPFYSLLTLTYNDGINYPVRIYTKLTFSSIGVFDIKLNNADDKYYGLEQKRVFGTWKNGTGSTATAPVKNRTFQVEHDLTVNAGGESITWESSNTAVATVNQSGVMTFKSNIAFDANGEAFVTIRGYSGESYEDSMFKDEYTFTLVDGCNIYSTADFELRRDGYGDFGTIVLQTSLGCSEDDIIVNPDGTTRPCITNFDFADDGNYDIINVQVYGNGHIINFANVADNTDGFSFARHSLNPDKILMTNLVIRGASNQAIAVTNRECQYTIFEGVQKVWNYSYLEIESSFTNCIFRDMTDFGLHISDDCVGKTVLKDNIFYDVGYSAIFFENNSNGPKLQINGYFDVYNFKTGENINIDLGMIDFDAGKIIKDWKVNNPTFVTEDNKVNIILMRGVALTSLQSMVGYVIVNDTAVSRNTDITISPGCVAQMHYATAGTLLKYYGEFMVTYPSVSINSTSVPDYTKVQRIGDNTISTYR